MSAASLLWGVLFGSVGFGYLVYGRRQRALVPALCGGALMVIPYVVTNVFVLVVVGAGLAAAPFLIKR